MAAALEALGRQERREGEPAFPAIGTIFGAIRQQLQNSLDRKAINEINERRAHFEAHPELYVSKEEFSAMVAPLEAKFNIERPKEIDTTPVLMACPHCSKELPVAPNIRFWTAEELRYHADTLDEVQRLAVANRAASLEAQQEPLTETV